MPGNVAKGRFPAQERAFKRYLAERLSPPGKLDSSRIREDSTLILSLFAQEGCAMSTLEEPGAGGPSYWPLHGRKMSRRRSDVVKRKNRKPFQPAFHGLEKRMMPATFLVSTVADSGPDSLRQAITDSNGTPGANTIDFGIGTGAQTISLLSALPSIMVPVTIDGTTQPGYTNVPLIDLDGTSAGASANGLVLGTGSDGSTIRALVINNFAGAGISITTTDNAIQGSYIGTNPAGSAPGTQPMANGIVVTAASNTIGGTAPGSGNLISGNAGEGVVITGSAATGNTVEGNLIGTDATGENPLGNTDDGIFLSAATGNTIGGPTSASRNVIAADGLRGIELDSANSNVVENNYIGTDAMGSAAMGVGHNGILDQGTSNAFIANVIDSSGNIGLWIQGNSTLVQGNLIGLNAAGTAALGNAGGGILVGASGNTIGGITPATRNVISGNIGPSTGVGISITSGTADNLIEGNDIGTNAAGTAPVANAAYGIEVQGSTGNTIGGATLTPGTGAGNLISGNAGDGVNIGAGTTDTSILGDIIGLDATGTIALGNGSSTAGNGVSLDGSQDTIGGIIAADRNIISGNYLRGVEVDGTGELVEGNFIGTDITGIAGLGNGLVPGYAGVYVSAANNTIGGNVAGAGNVIDDSGTEGIRIDTSAATGNLIAGNLIGVNVAGNAVPNHLFGILISTATANTIGGTVAAAANVISGNNLDGIDITGSNNLVEGNEIGTNPAGTVAVANSRNGVTINSGGTGNTIGGASTLAANLISGNTGYGIQLDGATTSGNIVANNFIGTGLQGSGTLLNSAGAMEITNSAAVLAQGGFTGDMLNQGTIGFWNPPGLITITGNYTQSSAGTLGVDLGGTSPLEHDQLQVSGTATLAGALDVALISGFSIAPLEEFQVLTYATLSGAFATDQYPNGVTLYPGYGPASLFLYSTPFELVTNSADTGAGSLRQAITSANALTNNPTWIVFNIPTSDSGYASGTWTIAPDSALPSLSAQVVLDGTTQPGFITAPIIVLNGASAGSSAAGVTIVAGGSGSAVRGFVVNGFAQDGIDLDGASNTTVEGNFIGTNAAGTANVANAGEGVDIDSGATDNTIGGTTTLDRNIISGNGLRQVYIVGGSNGNVVEGNDIGTDSTGNVGLPTGTGYTGVYVATSGNTIGGTVAGAGNVIAEAGDWGLRLTGANDNLVAGNMIGTNAGGTAALPNDTDGVLLDSGSTGNTIGGTTTDAINVISGNSGSGVEIASSGNLVEGNYLGTNATATAALANQGDGVLFDAGATGNTIGGATAAARNIISGNATDGIDLSGAGTSSNVVVGNYIGTGPTGTIAIANLDYGVSIDTSASGNTIGGATLAPGTGAGNVISGNAADGLTLQSSAAGNSVLGNIIGLTSAGTAKLGNGVILMGAGALGTGISMSNASSNTIGGGSVSDRNIISGNFLRGVTIAPGGTGNVLEGNFIGTDITGTIGLGNGATGFTGVIVSGAGNTIGGTVAGSGNVISGNGDFGLRLTTSSATSNLVAGNFIGVNATGTAAIPNASTGLLIDTGSSSNTVGGTTAAAMNVVSGNPLDGVEITGTGTSSNLVEGNEIGTNSAGTAAIPNALNGIEIDTSASGNTIGGLTGVPGTGLGNVISGNTSSGVEITGSGTMGNVVEGNIIGLNAAGAGELGNVADGVAIDTSASANTIGGATARARNVISGNLNGVVIVGATSTGNVVQGDYIGTDLTGMTAFGNSVDGIVSEGTSGLIGGATDDGQGNPSPGTAPGNLIAGSAVNLDLDGRSDVVAGNLIGLNANGTAPLFPATQVCLVVLGDDEVIGGMSPSDRNIITGAVDEVDISGSGDQLLNNYVGTDPTGTIGLEHIGQNGGGVGYGGVNVVGAGPGTVIGAPGAGNVIGDTYANPAGLLVEDTPGVVIEGNNIGTNAAGSAPLIGGDNYYGIYIENSDGFQLGGTAAGACNVISGNYFNDVTVVDTTGGVIEGNDIGTDATGMYAIPGSNPGNFYAGLVLSSLVSGVTVGGTTAAARNIISGSARDGIQIGGLQYFVGQNGIGFGAGVNQDNTVEGNYIGVNADGGALPNQRTGIDVSAGALGTVIGGTDPGEANVISGNAGSGVLIDGSGVPGFTPLYLKGDGNTNNDSSIYGVSPSAVTAVGGVTYGTGVTGQAFQFNDTPGERVVASDSYGLAATAVTLSAWINLSNLPGTTPFVIASQTYSATSENYGLYVNSSGELAFEWYSAGAFYTETSSGADLGSRLGNFQQVAVVTDGSTVIFYVNGVAVSSAAMPVPLEVTTTADFEIGGLANGPNLFNGLIDEISVTTDALPAEEIARIYANGGVGDNLGGSGIEDTTVAGNLIGTDPTGTTAIPNGGDGVEINGAFNNTIGGTSAGATNVISGNVDDGVEITGTGATGNMVAGNFIGTSVTGNGAIANQNGVVIDTGASGNTIGGTAAGAGNVISGNANDGVALLGTGTSGNVVLGNLIGTNVTGSTALGNGTIGVLLYEGPSDNLIGGTTVTARNIISGNGWSGVDIYSSNDNLVEGNFVGTDVSGDIALGNNGSNPNYGFAQGGITMNFGSAGNTIGGLTAIPGTGAGNLISGNTFAGVNAYGAGSSNLVAGNLIGTNVTGAVALGNIALPGGIFGGVGVSVSYSPDTIVGEPGGRNVIAGNGYGTVNGSNVGLSYSSGSVVQSNYLGTDITGTVALSTMTYYGVALGFGSYTIGGLTTTPGTGLGNVISGNATGIIYQNYTAPDTVVIEGNIIGADATGAEGLPNRNTGIALGQVSLVTIGGTAAGAGNLISGNDVPGSQGNINLSGSSDNLIEGNLVGTDITGLGSLQTSADDQYGYGVSIRSGSTDNTIGGTTAAARNIISGIDGPAGVFISDTATSGNVVEGNYIGTDLKGSVAIANNGDGVEIATGATGNTIGGLTSVSGTGPGNVISGNTANGVEITGSGTSGNVIAGNLIGLNAAGSSAIGNAYSGVEIDTSASSNTIGGPTASARNIISGNVNYGILSYGATGTVVQSNYIGTDLSGMAAIGNLSQGVRLGGSSELIGGATDDGQGNPAPGTAPGNVIAGNPNNLEVYGGSDYVIAGNLMGLNATGTAPLSFGGVDVALYGDNITLGGMSPNDRNVITGGFQELSIGGGEGYQVLNNYLGTDITGTIGLDHIGQIVSDGWVAISIDASTNVVIGAPGAGNLIADSWPYPYYDSYSISVEGAGPGLVIQSNEIGTNAAGTAAIPNGGGIYLDNVDGFLIGGTAPGAGNLISGNLDAAIFITSTDGGTIEGNDIGTDITGALAIPDGFYNGAAAVLLGIGASNVTIGGTTAAARNVISGNGGDGILISDLYHNLQNGFPNGSGVNQDNVVEGNYIGIKADGDALPNLGNGIDVATTALSTVIGGTASGAGNVISGNVKNGVFIDGTGLPSLTPLYLKADGNVNNSAFNSAFPVGNGTIEGGVTYGAGVTGQAFQFNDTAGESVVVPDAGYLADSTITLSAWINLKGLPGATPFVIASLAHSATSEDYGLYVNSAGELVFEWYSAGAFHTETSSGAALGSRLDEFQQVAVDVSETTVTFYVNGAAVGSSALPVPVSGGAPGNLEIGGLAEGPNLFNGLIDDLSITITPLPAGEIARIYANAGQGTDLGGSGTEDTTVAGNWIGTNALGTSALGNAGDGVDVNQGSGNTIGGTVPSATNLISGNTNGVEINGSSQDLVQGNMIGTDTTGALALGNTGAGVLIDNGSSSNTVGGPVGGARNLISGNAEGVVVSGATSIDVAGNLIGTDLDGTSSVPNHSAGVSVSGASGTTIGGTTILARNIISANTGDGVDLSNGATDTLIQNNYIGADQTGTQPLGNTGDGISINGAPGTTIGGTTLGAGNVISANAQVGVSIQGSASTGIAILGNFIGTDFTATTALGNGTFGVVVGDPPTVTIGGTGAGARNIISGNKGAGVGLVAGATGELVEGNDIGTDITGNNPLGNGTGVLIDGGSANNTIGGSAGAGNIIAYSAGIGVDVDATAGAGNDLRLNSIFSDGALGIDLGGDGVTLNNSVAHSGPNDYENFPVITGLSSAGGMTTVSGTFNSTATTTFALDFYTMSSYNASGFGEGRYLLGSGPLTTDASGNATFSFAFPTPSAGSKYVSATATDPSGNTSEFSHDFGSDSPPTAVIGFTTLTIDEGVAIPFDGSGSLDPEGSPLSYSWSFGDGGTATGVAPVHTYRSVGTFNVMLTVNDGFGGINSAMAAITVNDVPPAFVPRAFTPPVTFAAPATGDDFGASVASVAGNAAIGAPLDNGPTATDHPGAVFLYDGVPTDDGVSTTYAYKSLIHVFADPNPAAGDLFGAAIATVGTDLLIGAPGSSLTGPGDGAAYLFDADPSSPTFGQLLATFTLPDADSTHEAEFGAAVAAANTTILIGAPGKDGGSGEVVAFAGDPTQPTFGSPLFHIADPDHLAGDQFGAAIAGISANLIVGAPFDNTAGAGAGTVYLFTFSGTTATQTGMIVNPHPAVSTGFGTAVASVGPNVLIGSPLDATAGSGAGAAFLYDPSGTLLKTFVQPDGGGGHFGASVAGSGTTALIGAPGATLGTSDAGAAYLFDANPASSIFGKPIAAQQEPTPVTGDAFGSAVGFLDINGALLIGALGAGGSGAMAADLYQPGAPLSLSATTTYATAAPFDSVIVSGTFVVPGTFDTLTGSIDWGDGSAPTLVTLPPGSYAFSVPHDYTSATVARYAIGVTLSDTLGETAFAQTVVTMSNPAPEFAAPGLVLSQSNVEENATITASGTIESPGGIQTNTVVIDWGDGSTPTTIVLPAGTYTFSTPHTYLNNPPGAPSGSYTIRAQVTNQQNQIGQASASVSVSNVAPQFTAADLSLSESTATEGDTVTLNGQFTDPGTIDPHTVTIDWGDGSPPTALSELAGQVVATATPGLFTYSAAHQYANNPPGVPTGGTYDIHVSVSDDVSTTSADRFIVVNNAPPVVRIESTGNLGSGTISLMAVVTDPGLLDTQTVAWTLTQNGTVIATAPGPSFSFNAPSPVGVLVATATAKDSDGGTGSDSAQIVLILEGNATATITTSGITITQGGSTVESTPSAGAGLIIGLVYGSNDLVDASSLPATTDVELDGYGSSETLLGGAGDDLLSAGAGANSLAGGDGDDSLVSNRGDDTLFGGLGNDLFRINPGPDPVVVDPGGFNTLDFSIAALPVNINLGLDSGQVQDVDSANDQVSLNGQFDGLIASPKGGNITANDGNDLIYATTGNTTITGGAGSDSLVGGSGNDIIYATTGNTTITGGSGSESLVGGSGNDIIYSTTGNTTITGGSGHETLVGGQGNDIIYSTTGNTTITGGSGSESLVGGSGNDIIYSTTGNTTITGGSGHETLVGGQGNDIIYSTTGNTTITGGSGSESLFGGQGNDIIYATTGNTTITGGSGSETIVGGQGNDIIYLTTGNTTITGGSGSETITGGQGNDIIYSTTGNTTITGGSGSESLVGGSGNDIIYSTTGNTTITGGAGHETLVGGSGNDIIYATTGNTTITGGSGSETLVGGSGNDIIYATTGNTTITGGSGHESLVGGQGNDIIYATTGNTTITGGSGHETLVGGSGNDIIFGSSATAIIVGGSGNSSITGGSGDDVIVGGSGDDVIVGGTGDDQILGGTGNDSIVGGSGNDTITGGSGNDTITGGSGTDFISGGTGNDSITGGSGSDSIDGGSGADIIYGGALSSTITGGSGSTSIVGGAGNDIIYGGTGNSTITGGGGNDSIIGGAGNDIIYGGPGDDTLSGGTGNASISGGGGSDTITAGGFDSWLLLFGSMNMTLTDTTLSTSGGGTTAATSEISGFRHAILAAGTGSFTLDASAFSGSSLLLAGTGNDTLIGSKSDDTLEGGAGNDSLVGGGGNDTFAWNGGSNGSQTVVEPAGTNIATLDFSAAPAAIQINIGQTGPQTVIPGTLTLSLSDPMGISNVLGSQFNDTIIGNARNNTLTGGGGEDLIAGLGGNDVLEGAITRTVLLDFDTLTTPGDHIYTTAERDAIQAQLTADYSAFSYTFTQSAPSSGPYTTIFFNDPALTGLEGGTATSIDWLDQDIVGSTTLSAAGVQFTPADTASVNVANLLGQAGEPAATSADFIALSVTIAAHELGHLSGLEHGDSYGPIGSGIFVGVNPDLYRPAYPGPVDADETIRHIMASGASVNETLFEAIDDPFFGEREAIKLAYGEDGTPTDEQTAPHFSMADAQPLTLAPLVVPDTDLEGQNADQIFDVTAADVVGDLGLDASGNSLTDYYSFTAQAGTLINLQVMSAVLDRPQGAFDTTMTVYDSNGNVIAFDDDSFQDTDSTIIDLTLPATGTYYVEVTPYSAPGQPSHQTGAYELFMYTFATDGDPPAGDTMFAGSGIDTIIGGAADDEIAAQLPKDTIIYGSGTATVMSFAPYLDVSAGTNLAVSEGDRVTLTGSFIDPLGNATHVYDWHVVASNGQMIADGTGPSFTFSPGNAGTYTVNYAVSDTNGGSGSATVIVTASAVTPVLTAPTSVQNAFAGVTTPINLGTLAVKGIGPWTDTITWGDGQSSTFLPAGSGPLSQAHTYSQPGTYTVSETVSEHDGGMATASFSIVVTSPFTTTTLAPTAASAVYGQSLTFTATVTGQGTPTGTVAFYLGAITTADKIGTGGLSVKNGLDVATLSTPVLPASGSPYAITAVYSGDATFQGSTSNVATLTVKPDASTTSASASATSDPLGQTVTLTAKVTANAPGSGTPTGNVDFFDTTTGDDLCKVTLSGGVATLGITSLAPGPHSITVTYSGDNNFLASSTTTSTIKITQSIIVLDPTAGGALSIAGNASIKLTGGVYVDSSSSSAISASGNAQITASVIDVHGGVQKSGNASFNPSPVTKAATVSDPLANLPVPSTTGLTNYGAENLSGNSKATIKPGIYSGINVSGNAALTMSAGLYIIEGGGFQVSGNGSVTGTGVTLYNTGSKFPNSGGSFGAITLSGNGSISLSPSTTGAYAGILLVQPAANAQAISFSGNAMAGVTGTIYAPAAPLVESGNAQVSASFIVDTMSLSGNAIANIVNLAAAAGVAADVLGRVGAAEGASMPSASIQAPEAPSSNGTGQSIREDVSARITPVRSAGTSLESVLDELVANLLSSPRQTADRAGDALDRPTIKVTGGDYSRRLWLARCNSIDGLRATAWWRRRWGLPSEGLRGTLR
jgi:Ca2+-binding RTX toxin-like protein